MRKTKKLKDSEVMEILKPIMRRPDNFASFSRDDDLFVNTFYIGIGTTTRDDRDCMQASNQSVILDELRKINPKHVDLHHNSHWACGWVDQIAAKVIYHGKPTKVGRRVAELIRMLDEYPLLDEDDYLEREHEAAIEEIKYYSDDWIKDAKKYFGISDDDHSLDFELNDFISSVYLEDCEYHGRENAFFDENSIERFIETYEFQNNDHYPNLKRAYIKSLEAVS